jgi:hypothetical protein
MEKASMSIKYEFIAKPVTYEKLQERIDAALEKIEP